MQRDPKTDFQQRVAGAAFVLGLLFVSSWAAAQDASYPDMLGTWSGDVRIVASGEQVRAQVARGGAVIQDRHLVFEVTHQDGESFLGESVFTDVQMDPVPVFGAIRSTGSEAVFVTMNGGRGQLWFSGEGAFEFCIANATQEQMSSYCARLTKQD